MAAPTFVSETETAWNTNSTPKTSGSISVQAGDVLVGVGVVEGSESPTWNGTFTGGSLTWTERQEVAVTDYPAITAATAVAASTTSLTTSLARTAGGSNLVFGQTTFAFRGSDGVGASAKTNVNGGAPSLNITTTQDNSAIVVVVGDWNAVDGASRTWRAVNGVTPTAGNGYERSYFYSSADYTVYVAYYPDAGAAGTKTVGLSAPGSQKYSIVAIEVKGAAGGGGGFQSAWAVNSNQLIGVGPVMVHLPRVPKLPNRRRRNRKPDPWVLTC